jgi:hypothetical protein
MASVPGSRFPEPLRAALVLLFLLNLLFFPYVWGGRTLLTSSRDAASILPAGAFGTDSSYYGAARFIDAGASAWQFEPHAKVLQREYLGERNIPLWDPWVAFGTPFAAAMLPQPFYPLSVLAAVHPGPKVFNLFLLARLFLAGIFAYLYLRLFLPFVPSLAGGIAFMLSGYFILYMNIDHLGVDVLVAAVFWSFERLVREANRRNVLITALIVFLSLAGGMPESAFLILSWGYAYFLFRLLSDRALRAGFGTRIQALVFANVFGFLWAALLLIPFVELLRLDFDIHQPGQVGGIEGLRFDPRFVAVFTYLAPMIFGPLYDSVSKPFEGILASGYFGVIALFLALLALIIGIRQIARRSWDSVTGLTVFFFVSAALLLMKRFGSVLVNWLGYLPFFNLIYYPKYVEILMAMAVASLAAIGCFRLLDRETKAKWIGLAAVLIFTLIGFAFFNPLRMMAGQGTNHIRFFYASTALVLGQMGLMIFCVFVFRRFHSPAGNAGRFFQHAFGFCILALLFAELSLNFVVPSHYVFASPPSTTLNPYEGAPYISFLKQEGADRWRLFARSRILFPNWAEAFGLYDVRGTNAMTYRKYWNFLHFFLQGERSRDEAILDSWYIATGPLHFDNEDHRRFLQLSSVKYVLTPAAATSGGDAEDVDPAFNKVYDREISIYRYDHVLPRAALFYHAEAVEEGAMLRRLKDPTFDVFRTALVASETLDSRARAALAGINGASVKNCEAARITSYESQYVRIAASPDRPALLTLNDSDYPGWRVYVDGNAARMVTVNYLFRGVLLSAGNHQVEFKYEPESFRLGLVITLLGVLGAIVYGFWPTSRPRSYSP